MNLSIIIPIYNTPRERLKRCFESIRNIHERGYECILVDDGSINDTADYLKEYAQQVLEFKYIHKENGGVSSARNIGIEESSGEYVCFVDSDDEIEHTAFDYFLSNQCDGDIVFTYLKQMDNGQIFGKISDQTNYISYEEIMRMILERKAVWGPFCKFISKDFIQKHGVRFNTGMVAAEDLVFFLDLLIEKPKMLYIDMLSYYYNHDDSTGNNRVKKYKTLLYDNSLIFYTKLLRNLCAAQYEQVEYEALKERAVKEFVKGIFSVTLDMMELGIDYNTIEEEMAKTIKNADVSRSDLMIKTKYNILTGKRCRTLKLLAVIRRKYLNAKRKTYTIGRL